MMKSVVYFLCFVATSWSAVVVIMADITPHTTAVYAFQFAWSLLLFVSGAVIMEKDVAVERVKILERSLHTALCIIENDCGPPHTKAYEEARKRWVQEIERESGIDRSKM